MINALVLILDQHLKTGRKINDRQENAMRTKNPVTESTLPKACDKFQYFWFISVQYSDGSFVYTLLETLLQQIKPTKCFTWKIMLKVSRSNYDRGRPRLLVQKDNLTFYIFRLDWWISSVRQKPPNSMQIKKCFKMTFKRKRLKFHLLSFSVQNLPFFQKINFEVRLLLLKCTSNFVWQNKNVYNMFLCVFIVFGVVHNVEKEICHVIKFLFFKLYCCFFPVIEHLRRELRDRFTEMREMDLGVQSKLFINHFEQIIC